MLTTIVNERFKLNFIYFSFTRHSTTDKRRVYIENPNPRRTDFRSARSLDFESDTATDKNVDYTSEPVSARIRPTPPKKPLRLSLHRAQSLQTVEAVLSDIEKKRTLKRPHRAESTHQLIENSSPMVTTASLGRRQYV